MTRKNEKNIVMLSLEAYNNIMENLFIASNQANYRHILDGVRQLEAGHAHPQGALQRQVNTFPKNPKAVN